MPHIRPTPYWKKMNEIEPAPGAIANTDGITHSGAAELFFEGEPVFLNHRVGEYLTSNPGHFCFGVGATQTGIQANFEILALPYAAQTLVSHLRKGVVDGFTLRIEDTLFEGNVDVGHHGNPYYTSVDNGALSFSSRSSR